MEDVLVTGCPSPTQIFVGSLVAFKKDPKEVNLWGLW